MSNFEWLVVGLGNPGTKYQRNRHNIGWMIIDKFIEKYNLSFSDEKKSLTAKLNYKSKNIILAKPTTFMNLSGKAVQTIKIKYKIPNERIIAIVDDYNLPLGKLHLKLGGSDAGHNGVLSIIQEINDKNFYRLRCGIGNDFPKGMLVDYVLSNFRDDESDTLDLMIQKALQSIETVVEFGAARAMTLINSERLWKSQSNNQEVPQ